MAQIKSGLPFGLVVLTILIGFMRIRQIDEPSFMVLIIGSGIILCLYAPYFWFRKKSPGHGNLHLIFIWLALLCMLVFASILGSFSERVLAGPLVFSWLILSALALISNIIAVPRYLLPALSTRLTGRDETPASNDETVAIVDIESTIKELRIQFDKFYQVVSQQRVGLQETFSRMQQEFKSQTDAIVQAKRDVDEAREKAAYYRRVANLSKEDQRVFLELIARNKRQDYWIGLGTGIVSSVFTAAVIWLLGKLSS